MEDTARIVTELRLRREVAQLTRAEQIAEFDRAREKPTGLTDMTLYYWEIRQCVPRGRNEEILKDYFKVGSIAELGLGHRPESASRWTWATKEEMEEEVDRRVVAKTLAAGAGETALLPVGRLVQAAQRLGGRRRIGLEKVKRTEQVATHLAAKYIANPSDETRAAAIAHARTLTDRLTHVTLTPEVRLRLAAVASDAAALVGVAKRSAGRMTEADAWFDHAIALAREADDRRLEALALAAKAWAPGHLLGSGDRADSLEALRAAAALDGHLPAAGRAYVHGFLARELAAGRDDGASGRALERALTAAALVGREEPGWGYWSRHAALSGWDGVRPTAYTGLRPLYLGRYRDAIPLLSSALEGTLVPVRRARLHADLTQASAGLGDRDQACSAAVAALDEAKPYGFGAVRDDIRALRAGFPSSWEGSAVLAALDERLVLG